MDLSPFAQHERIALSFSGGKDSLAVYYLLREHKHRFTVYHCNTGDLLPEQSEVVAHVRADAVNFVEVKTDAIGWINQNGLPTDLLPHTAHWVGREMGEPGVPLVSRYDCCWSNLMEPTYRRVAEDGNTLLIRGTKAADMKRLPKLSGSTSDGITLWYPLQDWTNDQVFAYLREQGAPISRVYDHVTNSPECARCTAWWGEKRGDYLRRYHPDLWRDYSSRLGLVVGEINKALAPLIQEMSDTGQPAEGFTNG